MVSREVEAEHLWVVSKRLASSAEESQYFVWFQYSCFTLLIQSSWKVSFHCNKNIPYVDWLQLPVPIGQLNYAFIGKWFHELNTQGVRELSKMTSTKRRGGQHYTQPMSAVKKWVEYQRTDAAKVWIADMSADGMAFYRKCATVQMKHEQLQQWERFGEVLPNFHIGFWILKR